MGTSFVEYKGFGFWTRDNFLENWLITLLGEIRKLPSLEPWQESLREHWCIQGIISSKGSLMAVACRSVWTTFRHQQTATAFNKDWNLVRDPVLYPALLVQLLWIQQQKIFEC
jgi:hypothetical protein